MRVFDFLDYKEFVNAHIHALPNQGRGQYQKIALSLRVHSTLVSQIFNGDRHLTCEQGCDLAEHLGLNQLETDYFLNLILEARAASVKLQRALKRQREKILQQAKALTSHFPKGRSLTEGDEAIYYSQWHYSAILLLTQIPGFTNADAIAQALALPLTTVRQAIDFLLKVGLVSEERGKLKCEQNWMTVSRHSLHVVRHHVNWRLKAMENLTEQEEDEIALTGPITLSQKDAVKVKRLIEKLLTEVSELVEDSPPETLRCLNLDFFKVT